MHTHTSFEAENEAAKRLSDAFRVADSTRSEEYHEQYPQRFTMSARREEVGTAKQNATSNTHNDSPCLRDEKRWASAKQNATSNTHNDSPCLRDEKRWESAKENATSNTHNDSPCLRDEKRWESAKEPICLQTLQNTTCNTHNDSPCLREEKRWELRSRMPRAIPTTIHHVCAMRRGGKVRSRMQRAVPTTIHHVCAMRSLSAEYNFARAIPTTIHHACAMRRGGKVRRKEVQHVRLSLTPAVFSARHFSRRPSVASGGHIRTRRPGPQAGSPQHSNYCTRAAPGRQPRLQMVVPYDSRNLTLTNEVSQPPRDCHGHDH